MTTQTKRQEQGVLLCVNAMTLITDDKRSPGQVSELIFFLQGFKNEKSRCKKYPGSFGNRCSGCGGYIDEGGICHCGWIHKN